MNDFRDEKRWITLDQLKPDSEDEMDIHNLSSPSSPPALNQGIRFKKILS